MGMKLLAAFPFPGRSQRGRLRSDALGMLRHTRATLHHAWHSREGASLPLLQVSWGNSTPDWPNPRKNLSWVGFLQSSQLMVELEQTGLDQGTGPPQAALLGCQVIQARWDWRAQLYPGPHPLPRHPEPWELPEWDHRMLPRLGLARLLKAGLCTSALA